MLPRNYAPRNYKRGLSPKALYWHMVSLGIPEAKASEMSGYSEAQEIRSAMRTWTISAVIVAIVAAALIYIPPVLAAEDGNTERWFAACLGGAEITVGDRAFRCMDVGPAR